MNAKADPGHLDELTVDAQDAVWSARWDGGRIVRYSSDGKPLTQVAFPAQKLSCLTFGGPAYQDAYVTTAIADESSDTEGDGAGSVFRFDPGVCGVSEFTSEIWLPD